MDIPLSSVARNLVLPILMVLPGNAALAAAEEVPSPGQGMLQAKDARAELVLMPLRHTEVRAEVTGFVARVEVVQTFGNPFDSAIEATYVFPLPERAAVDDFLLEVGERLIHGEIRRREEARKVYEEARAAGYTASLLDQQRPNIFTQSVANIPPGKQVKVHLRYVDMLPYADGAYRFLFPMVVGPRYSPGSTAFATAADGEAARPAYLKPGLRAGNDIAITLDLDAGVPIRSIASASHRILVTNQGPTRARVALAPDDTYPNKDLMLRWEVAGGMPEVGVLAHRGDDDGFFALLIQPKAEVLADEAAPKEIIFVLDQSGSMSGLPIEMSKRFMRLALKTLGARDRFNLVRFDSSATTLAPEPLFNTEANVQRGLGAVEAMSGSGGTEMLAGFHAALAQPRDPACIRIVIFLTDGFIGNEEDIFRVIREGRGDARIFAVGIGSSVNHHLLRGMADLGHGAYQYIRPDGREKEAVERFQSWVTRPYLTDLEIDWGALRVEDVQPSRLPDLYSGQTLSVVGRYVWGGSDTLIIRGRLGGVPWERQVEVTLPEHSEQHAALASVWARHRINELLMRPGGSSRPEIEAQVTSLALAFRLMSPFTSFVAVDDSVVVNPGGDPFRVDQPSPMPEFVSFEGCFGAGGPGRTESLPIPAPAPVPRPGASTGEIQVTEGSGPPGQAAIEGTVHDTEGDGLPGVVVESMSRSLGVSRQSVSDVDGRYRTSGLAPANDYVVRVAYAGFAPIEIGPLKIEAGRRTILDVALRTTSELTETIIVESRGNLVDTGSSAVSSSYSANFVDGLPAIGHNYQDVQTLSPGATGTDGEGNPNVHGARDTELHYRIDGAFGQNLNAEIIEEKEVITSGASAEYSRADGGFANIITRSRSVASSGAAPLAAPAAVEAARRSDHGAATAIEEAALRVLADLADDGRLSRSEGLPALAGLLQAQYSNGGFSLSVRVQTIATWALAAAAASDPRLRWAPDAAHKAAEFLTMIWISSGALGDGDDAWADFVLAFSREGAGSDASPAGIGPTGRCFDPRRGLERSRGKLGRGVEELVVRILAGPHGPWVPLDSP